MVCHNALFLPLYFLFSLLGKIGFSLNRRWCLYKSGYETLPLMVWNTILMKNAVLLIRTRLFPIVYHPFITLKIVTCFFIIIFEFNKIKF